MNRENMAKVTAAKPCPVCEKSDWCMIAADDSAAICQRIESDKRCGDAGWLHILKPDAPRDGEAAKDWPALAAKFAAARPADKPGLGLPPGSFDALPLVGWNAKERCYTFPEMNAAGSIIGISRRFQDGPKKTMAGGKRGLTLPTGWRDKPGPVFIVEGPTDTAAMIAAGLCAIGRPSNSGGVKTLATLLSDWPTDRGIVVVGENDRKPDGLWPGKAGADTVARALATTLKRAVLTAMPPDGAKDVRDWLTATTRGESPWPERGGELTTWLIAHAVEPVALGVPSVVIDTDEHRVIDETIAALAADVELFQRGGNLVSVISTQADDTESTVRKPAHAAIIRNEPTTTVRERITRHVRLQQWRGAGEDAKLFPAHPPEWLVNGVHRRGQWPGVRRLDAVVTHPVVMSDGEVLAVPGYHAESGLFLALPPGLTLTVPDEPSSDDVRAAVEAILEPLEGFPFASDADKAAWLAGLLTPLAWYAYSGETPFFLIEANVRGAGKTKLADCIAIMLMGRRFSTMSYVHDGEEMRKRITALAVEGERLVQLDNIEGRFGNGVLCQAMTAEHWKDRLLGTNASYSGPLQVVWYGTANNTQLAADMARRLLPVRLETPLEHPESRANFKYPKLNEHLRDHRASYLSAALTILRGWFSAGKPTHGLSSFGSFEGWSNVVREAVVFAGLPDPCDTRVTLYETADRDAVAMETILRGLEELDTIGRGLTAAEIIARVKPATGTVPDELAGMHAAIEELCGQLDSRRLAMKFRSFKRRNFGGRMLQTGGRADGSNRWRAVSASSVTAVTAGDAGHTGDVSPAVASVRRKFTQAEINAAMPPDVLFHRQ